MIRLPSLHSDRDLSDPVRRRGLLMGPVDLLIVERAIGHGVELHGLEIGREVEVARRQQSRMAAVKDALRLEAPGNPLR